MASFFEKLKKGMGIIEEGVEEKIEETREKPAEEKITKPARKARVKKIAEENKSPVMQANKFEVKTLKIEKEPEIETKEMEQEIGPFDKLRPFGGSDEPSGSRRGNAESSRSIEIKELSPAKESKLSFAETAEGKEKWPGLGGEPEGQLAIDVYQTENDLVIQSAIAGVKPDTLDISMEKDMINIKGSRQKPFEENGDYFSQECFWGPFSREIILPADVDPNRAEATMKDGILTIRIPKILREKKRKIVVKG